MLRTGEILLFGEYAGEDTSYIADMEAGTAPSAHVTEPDASSTPPRSRRAARAVVEGAAAAAGTFLVLLGLTYVIELLFAHGSTQSPLPSPDAAWVRWPTLVLAGIVGAGFGHRRYRRPEADGGFPLPSLALAVLVALCSLGYGQVQEGRFLDDYPAASCGGQLHLGGVGLSPECRAVLAAGRHACGWLAAQPWGEPAYDPSARSGIAMYSLYPQYVRDLGNAGTPADRLRKDVAIQAWTQLCPLQRLVHRQIPGSD